jgi:hypothetical protein
MSFKAIRYKSNTNNNSRIELSATWFLTTQLAKNNKIKALHKNTYIEAD